MRTVRFDDRTMEPRAPSPMNTTRSKPVPPLPPQPSQSMEQRAMSIKSTDPHVPVSSLPRANPMESPPERGCFLRVFYYVTGATYYESMLRHARSEEDVIHRLLSERKVLVLATSLFLIVSWSAYVSVPTRTDSMSEANFNSYGVFSGGAVGFMALAAFLSLSFYIFLNGIGLQYGSRFVRAFKFVLALPVYFFVAGLGCLLIVLPLNAAIRYSTSSVEGVVAFFCTILILMVAAVIIYGLVQVYRLQHTADTDTTPPRPNSTVKASYSLSDQVDVESQQNMQNDEYSSARDGNVPGYNVSVPVDVKISSRDSTPVRSTSRSNSPHRAVPAELPESSFQPIQRQSVTSYSPASSTHFASRGVSVSTNESVPMESLSIGPRSVVYPRDSDSSHSTYAAKTNESMYRNSADPQSVPRVPGPNPQSYVSSASAYRQSSMMHSFDSDDADLSYSREHDLQV